MTVARVTAAAFAADLAAIAVFAAVGRSSHAESVTLAGVTEVAWPFLAGAAVGAVVARGWRRPTALSSGVAVWLGAVVGGMSLRALTGAGVAVSFVVVAGITLAVFLLGWRVLYRWLRARRLATPVEPPA